MTFQYLSDLHLEFDDNYRFIEKYPIDVAGDILLIAGDLIPFTRLDRTKHFFSFVAKNYEKTFWIPGNHEYYGSDIHAKGSSFKESIKKNVFLVNNYAEQIGDVKLVLSTMWSKIDPDKEFFIERSMNDFYQIRNKKGKLSAPEYNKQHQLCMDFLIEELAKGDNSQTIVVTHHVPTFLNYPEQFKESMLNQAFAVELYDLILKYQPHSWIYGHSHGNTPDFKIENTQMLTNQLGYIAHDEQRDFSNNKGIIFK